jgi:hypothetical protein
LFAGLSRFSRLSLLCWFLEDLLLEAVDVEAGVVCVGPCCGQAAELADVGGAGLGELEGELGELELLRGFVGLDLHFSSWFEP